MSQELRDQFEADCFAYYQRLKASGWAHSAEGDQTPESLFWRRETNPEMYGIHQVEAAWQGYQMRAGREALAPVGCPTYETGSGDYVVCRRCRECWAAGSPKACVRAAELLKAVSQVR